MTKWGAFRRQAMSDLVVFEALAGSERSEIPECHPLHYLQMAAEKIAKAAIIADNPTYDEFTHKPLSDLIRLLKRRDVAVALGRTDFNAFQGFIKRSALPLLREIEALSPAVGQSAVNVEYPWQARNTSGRMVWRAPADHSFGLLARLHRTADGVRLLRLISDIIERFDSVFAP